MPTTKLWVTYVPTHMLLLRNFCFFLYKVYVKYRGCQIRVSHSIYEYKIENAMISDMPCIFVLTAFVISKRNVCVKISLIDAYLFIVLNIKWWSVSHYEIESFLDSRYRFRKFSIFAPVNFDPSYSDLTSKLSFWSISANSVNIPISLTSTYLSSWNELIKTGNLSDF